MSYTIEVDSLDDLLTPSEAGKILDLQAQTVKYHIKRGIIKAVKIGGTHYVRREDVLQFKKTRDQRL
jgi:excisionase family DNA binding protein